MSDRRHMMYGQEQTMKMRSLARAIHDASTFVGYGLPAMTRLSILSLQECGTRWNFVALCGTTQMGGDLISSGLIQISSWTAVSVCWVSYWYNTSGIDDRVYETRY